MAEKIISQVMTDTATKPSPAYDKWCCSGSPAAKVKGGK